MSNQKNYCLSNPTVVGEEIHRRTENTKVFRRSDGTHLMVLYPDPVHYRKNGQWCDIDNHLLETVEEDGSAVYRNHAGAMDIHLPRHFAPGKFITINRNGYTLRYRMEGNFSGREAQHTIRDRQLPHASQVDSTLDFAEVFPNTDISYVLHANELKEFIRLKERPDTAPVYTFTVEARGLTPFLQDDGSIYFRPQGATEDEPVFVFPAPFLVDAKGEQNHDVAVHVGVNDRDITLSMLRLSIGCSKHLIL